MQHLPRFLALVAAPLALPGLAQAQVDDVFLINDAFQSTSGLAEDQLLRLADIDGNGDYFAAGEGNEFFSYGPPVPGGYWFRAVRFRDESGAPVTYILNNRDAVLGNDQPEILRGVDTSGDGRLQPGEVSTHLDLTSVLTGTHRATGLALTPDGGVWAATRFSGGALLRHRAGVTSVYADDNAGLVFQANSTTGGGVVNVDTTSFSRLTNSGNGVLAFIDGFNATRTEAIFRFEDLNDNGVAELGEFKPFLIPTDINPNFAPNPDFKQSCGSSSPLRSLKITNASFPGANQPPFFVGRLNHLATMQTGGGEQYFFACDSSNSGGFAVSECGLGVNGLIFRGVDVNLDGDVNDAGEVNLFYDGSATNGGLANSQFDKVLGLDVVGSTLYVTSLNGGITVTALTDLNSSGAIDPGEDFLQIWDSALVPPLWNLFLFVENAAAYDRGAFATPGTPFSLIGSACASGTGSSPTITASGNLSIGGSTFAVEVGGATPGLPVIHLVGFSTTQWLGIPLPFELTPVGFPGCNLNVSFDLSFNGTADAQGQSVLPVPLPNSPVLVGVPVGFQSVAIFLNGFIPGGKLTQGLVATISQ
jgi:hypothetical protein